MTDKTTFSPSAPSLQEREKLSEIVDDQRVPLWSALTREFTLFGCWPRERVLAVAAQAYALGLLAALAAPPEPQKRDEFRDTRGKHIYEGAAMQIVLMVKQDIAPDMDDNAGGELLGWILQLTEHVALAAPSPFRARIDEIGRLLMGYVMACHAQQSVVDTGVCRAVALLSGIDDTALAAPPPLDEPIAGKHSQQRQTYLRRLKTDDE